MNRLSYYDFFTYSETKSVPRHYIEDLRLILFPGFMSRGINLGLRVTSGEVSSIESTPLDLPFSSCWFESMDDDLCVVKHSGIESMGEKMVNIMSLFVTELSFNQYVFGFCWQSTDQEHQGLSIYDTSKHDPEVIYFLKKVVQRLLREINESEVGAIEHGVKKIYAKSREGKFKIKPKKIVYIHPKGSEKPHVIDSKPIDWSHSWEVRGHWRKVPRIGADRSGEYCVPGYTWVRPFKKGKGEFIKKTRVLSQNP